MGLFLCLAPNDLVVLVQDDDVILLDDTGSELIADDTDLQDVDNEDYNEISVPLTIILAVISGYLFLGTVLFRLWEGWDSLTAAYYCFITIATIGFGDVVPSVTNPGEQYVLLGTALYMLFGMATLSMCFTLVQDQMAAKFRLFGEKFGIFVRNLKNGDQGEQDPLSDKQRTLSLAAVDLALSQTGTVPTAGIELFELRRRRRAAQLKFRWIRQRLSRKKRATKQPLKASVTATLPSTSVATDLITDMDQRPRNGNAHPILFDDTVVVHNSDKELSKRIAVKEKGLTLHQNDLRTEHSSVFQKRLQPNIVNDHF